MVREGKGGRRGGWAGEDGGGTKTKELWSC